MFYTDIPPGKFVKVTTKGDKRNTDIAPPLTFKGRLVVSTPEYVEIAYPGKKVVTNDRGKVVGWEHGEKVQRIYGSTIHTMRALVG